MTLTVIFGLFHGLLYLPVMLMLLGSDNVGDGIETDIENNEPNGFPMKIDHAEGKKMRNGVDNPSLKLDEPS